MSLMLAFKLTNLGQVENQGIGLILTSGVAYEPLLNTLRPSDIPQDLGLILDLIQIPGSVFPDCQLEPCFFLPNHAGNTSVSGHFSSNFNKRLFSCFKVSLLATVPF